AQGGGGVKPPGGGTNPPGGGGVKPPGGGTNPPGTRTIEQEPLNNSSSTTAEFGDFVAAAAETGPAEPSPEALTDEPVSSVVTRRRAPNPSPLAALDAEKQALSATLKERGLPGGIALRYLQTSDPALIREILAYHDGELPNLKNPAGALRSMLKKPEDWGFERTAAGWQRPPPTAGMRPNGGRPPTQEELLERMRREDEACRKEQEEANA